MPYVENMSQEEFDRIDAEILQQQFGTHPHQVAALAKSHRIISVSASDQFGRRDYRCSCGESALLSSVRAWEIRHQTVFTAPYYRCQIAQRAGSPGRLRCACGWEEAFYSERERVALIRAHLVETEAEQRR